MTEVITGEKFLKFVKFNNDLPWIFIDLYHYILDMRLHKDDDEMDMLE